MESRRVGLIVALVLGVFEPTLARTPPKLAVTNAIEIKIETSNPRTTAGTGLGVTAEVRNLSGETIYLNQKYFQLIVPTELLGPFSSLYSKWAFFPASDAPDPKDLWNANLALKPGESYRVFWRVFPEGTQQANPSPTLVADVFSEVQSELHFIFFSPGEYKITVEGHYWTDASLPQDDYHVAIQSTVLHVDAPQFVILFGASLGGLMAYFIFPKARRRLITTRTEKDSWLPYASQRLATESAGIVASVLLSSIVTILLSRISASQFPISITVTDLWGGIAIGFFANYGGSAAIDKLLKGGSSGKQQSPVVESSPESSRPDDKTGGVS